MLAIIILAVTAVAFLVFGKGYNYFSYALLFAAFLIAAFKWFPDGLKKAIALLTASGLIYFCIAEYPVLKNRKTDTNPGRDYIIVLGAAVHGSTPSLSLQHRLEKAYDYLIEYPSSVAIVSGGKGNGEDITEAECMKNYLVSAGIDESRILEESRSTSTKENLEFSKKIILSRGGDLGSVAILSSPYHLYRAKYMADALGYENVAGVACRYGYPVYSLGMFIREAFGVTHMWAFGD